MQQIPLNFKAVQITEYGKHLQIDTIPTTELQNGEFLFRVEAAPINPSDVLFMKGEYAKLPLPCTPGWDGSGVIVQLGPGTPVHLKVGDRVAANVQLGKGTYAEYAVGHIDKYLKLEDETTFEQGASFYGNPITVLGMMNILKKSGVKAFVHNAAASALGRQLSRYAKSNNINIINIVRRQEQVEILKSDGAEIVLNENDTNFNQQLQQMSEQLKAIILFDPVSGERTGQLLQFIVIPKGSTAYVYGLLSGSANIVANFFDLALNKKSIKGYAMTEYFDDHPNIFQDLSFHKKLNELIRGDLKTNYQREFKLDQINEAVELSQTQASFGKILIRPQQI